LCDDDEDDCTKLEKEITVTIYSEMFVNEYAKNQEACENAYAIDFYKDHCGGEPSAMMSYIYQGCWDRGGLNNVKRISILLWDITFTHEEDMLNVNVVEADSKITGSMISAEEIYEMTNGGSKSFVIVAIIYDNEIDIQYMAFPITKYPQNP